MESQILNIIKTRADWREYIADKNIRIKEDPPYAIFNYGPDVDPLDPVVREARGIIIDLEQQEVVCWPFTRFYNSYEEAAKEDLEKFDWDHCRVEEKVDGSIIKCWFDKIAKNWHWSTNSCIDASKSDAICGKTFEELIKQAVNYHQIQFEALDRNCTYIFELVSPYQQIVIKYPVTMLYHIGTRDNRTGEEDWRYIGIVHPEVYHLNSLDDCLNAAQELNRNEDQVGGEGFVIVDRNWRRLKVKSPEYVAAHRLLANRSVNKEHIIDVIREAPESIDEICKDFPDLAVYYRYYQYKVEELVHDVGKFIAYVRRLYDEYNHDKKAVALTIKNFPLAPFGFEALKSDADATTLITNISKARYLRLIEDYKETDVLHHIL